MKKQNYFIKLLSDGSYIVIETFRLRRDAVKWLKEYREEHPRDFVILCKASKYEVLDEWSEIRYPELNAQQNELIREARRKGFADFYPAFPDGRTQSFNTLSGAIVFLATK